MEVISDHELYETNRNRKLEVTEPEPTCSKLEFDKFNLFFKTVPNKINFDKIKVKNTGTTCIYYKWQKNVKAFNLPEKKSEGIDRFFCHYSDSKLFPGEEREFVFSFFSEKNGVFSEDWILVTSPPIKSFNSIVHLNGMCVSFKDTYTEPITELNLVIEKKSNKTLIEEIVLDLISTIREVNPPLPDMTDIHVFKFHFLLHNKEYNVEFSSYIMGESKAILNQIHDVLLTPQEDRYWSGSFDELKKLAESIKDTIVNQEMLFKIEILIHIGRRKISHDSLLFPYFKNKLLDFGLEFNEIANSIREEFQMPLSNFDLYTKAALNEKELVQYKNELNKRKDEFYKKTKKKPPKAEEEEKEINDFKLKFYANIKEKIMDRLRRCETEKLEYLIEESVMNSYLMNEEYIDRLVRVKSLKSVKKDGLEGKTVILRIDIEEYEHVYDKILNEENEVIGETLREIVFPNAKETILQTMSFLLDNRVKAAVLLLDFGPKIGVFNQNYQAKYLKDYLEKENLVEQSVNLLTASDLYDLQRKIDTDEVFKENSLLIIENLNFNAEECGFEIENDNNLTTVPGTAQHLKYYSKFKYVNSLSLRENALENLPSFSSQIFILDSHKSILKLYPSIIDMQCEVRCLGLRLESQLHKLTNFVSINSPNFMLVIGDIEFNSDNKDKKDNIDDTSSFIDQQNVLSTLLMINCLLPRFKRIFILGKVGILFIHFIQNEYVIDPKYKLNSIFHNLMKYILVRADLHKVKITFPEDGIVLKKEEYMKFRQGFKMEIEAKVEAGNNEDEVDNLNETIIIDDYYKYIKKLFKMEKKIIELEALKLDPEELLEHEDYIKNKLSDEEILLLLNYKNNNIEFKTSNYRKNFVNLQQIHKPKKVLKNEFEVRLNIENMYRKNVVYPTPTTHTSTHNNTLNIADIKDTSLNHSHNMSQNIHETENSHHTDKKTLLANSLFDYEEYEFVDYGEKTYNRLTRNIGKTNCLMWLGKLSPSIVENLNDNYSRIVRSLYERKQKLRSDYNDLMEEDKKPNENDLKAKKHLFTIFLKSKTSYDYIRRNFLSFMLPAEDKDAEVPPDEEQFNYEMNLLIDYTISEEFEFINSILKGDHVPGLFGLSQDPKKEKESELDLKFLEEIY